MRYLIDYLKLFGLKGGRKIFLRNQFDRYFTILLKVARIYRRTVLAKTKMVVVVGSLGKTTTKHIVSAVLKYKSRQKYYSNYGSSLACNLLSVRSSDKYGVLEAGISRPGMMDANAYLSKPDIVIVTSIAGEHYRSFSSLEETRKEKVKIVAQLPPEGMAILNGDDENVRWMASQTKAQVFTFGFQEDNNLVASDLVLDWAKGMTFNVRYNGKQWPVSTAMFGRQLVYPVLAALATVIHTGEDMEEAIHAVRDLAAPAQRMQYIRLNNNITVIDDAYKNGIETIQAALEAFKQTQAKRRIVVMGDIADPPKGKGDIYRDMGKRIAEVADIAILLGGNDLRRSRSRMRQMGMPAEDIIHVKNNVHLAIEALRGIVCPGDVILVKGRGTQKFQRIVLALRNIKVSCPVKICDVKVQFCHECPMLDKHLTDFQNYYILPYVKM